MRHGFLSLIVSLRKVLRDMRRRSAKRSSGAYKPERHYMRGPGPRYAAKHGVFADDIR